MKTEVDTWFERDRAYVILWEVDDDGDRVREIMEWWDEAVGEAVEDGFLNPRDWHGSARAYAEHLGLLPEGRS